MQRRSLMGATAAAGLALTGTACAPSSSSAPSGDGTTLNVWTWRVEDEQAYTELFDKYTEQNPDVTVKYRAYRASEYNQILATGLAGSEGPDVCMVKQYGALQSTIAGGGIIPLDDKVANLSNFDDVVLDGVRGKEDGLVYGVPFALQTIQIYYNVAVFAEHGLEPPTSYAEFIEHCERLKAAGVVPIAIAGQDSAVALPITFDGLTSARYGGRDFEEKVLAGDTNFSSPEYVAALQMMADLQPYFPDRVTGTTGEDAELLFATGKAAMYVSGTYALGVLRGLGADLEIDWFSMPIGPDWESSTALVPAYIDGGYAVASNSPNIEAATDLVNWMGSAEFAQGFADGLQQLSPHKDVTLSDPLMQRMKDDYASHGSAYLMLVSFRYGQPWGTDVLGGALQRMMLGEQTAEQAGEAIDKELAAWFRPGE